MVIIGKSVQKKFVVPFTQPGQIGGELERVSRVLRGEHWSANGEFSGYCEQLVSERLGGGRVFLTHTCSDALEAAIIIAGIDFGDEVIMPSYTFVANATAVANRGAVPVFVDVDFETLSLDLHATRRAITNRTRAINIVHYAGVGRDAAAIRALADEYGLILIEDAAHAFGCSASGTMLGRIGHLATLSFHDTKNITCGEGGALIVNDESLLSRSETVIDKGTDRSSFERGIVAEYTWQELGASYRASEIAAAVLSVQL
jgi:dTDP-4-amino-4,6-dideoxygalactose transaminase